MENQIAVFGGGCFWCTEAVFQMLKGVVAVAPGYAGGTTENPTYEEVSSGRTGHAEATRIEFNPKEISYAELLTVFFATHDPTTLNRQGNDVGTQYRSAIFYTSEAQKAEAEKYIASLQEQPGDPIVTEVVPLKAFYEAEDYHHNYYQRNGGKPYCQLIISPKVQKVKEKFAAILSTKGLTSVRGSSTPQ